MMVGCCVLAIRYLTYYWARSCILLAAITVTLCLPLATGWIIERFERESMARASETPVVIGTKGSQFGLVMHALYFRGEAPEEIPQSQLSRISKNAGILAIPLHCRFKARGYSVVGSNDDYLRLRKLNLDTGQSLERLGDCLLGANVARDLGLQPGERLVTDPLNMFDLSGPAPLSLRVRGWLAPTGGADDDVVHCSIQTCWVIAGLGHGHSLPNKPATESSDKQPSAAANSAPEPQSDESHLHSASRENLPQYSEVTDDNLRSFHFHGSQEKYPLTAIIAIPESERAGTLLLGKFLNPDEKYQAIRPVDIVSELLQMVAQVRRLIDGLVLILGLATALLVILVLWLSLKLRQRELQTLVLLGTSRATIVTIVSLEIVTVMVISAGLALLLSSAIAYSSRWLIYWLIV